MGRVQANVRTLTETLEAAQQSESKDPYLKIVVGAYTFGTDRVLSFVHEEQPFGESFKLVMDNSDGYFTEKNLGGEEGVLGQGFVTSEGDEYVDCSPFSVITQSFSSLEGRLICELSCIGKASELALDRASESYKDDVTWSNPTANESTTWTNPEYAWDADDETYATSGAAASELIVTQAAGTCSKARFLKEDTLHNVEVWVYKDDAWWIYFQGVRGGDWQEIEFPEGSVTKAKILFPDNANVKLYWLQFGNKSVLTVKDLIDDMFDGSMVCYNHCQTHTLSYDGALDDIIDTVVPGSDFRVPINASRMAAAKRLLDYTYCVMRPEEDEKIHIFKPVITGEVYDYEYGNAHVFYAKRKSNNITIPNYVIVKSPESETVGYYGEAKDQDSIDAYHEVRFHYLKHGLEDDAEAAEIAGAVLSKFQMHQKEAGATVPVNLGAELYDYVKITDAREGTTVTGNIGYIRTEYGGGKFNQTFGLGGWLSTYVPLDEIGGLPGEGMTYFSDLVVGNLYLDPITLDQIIDGETYKRVLSGFLSSEGLWLMDEIDDDDSDYKRVLATQVSAGKIYLSSETEYAANYDPSTKWTGEDLDDLPDGLIHSRVLTTDITDGHIKLEDVIQTTLYRTCSDSDKTTWSGKPDDCDELGEGVTYQKVRATQINGGYLKLTSQTVFDGVWYSEGSVTIDADSGIKGTHNGSVTWELKNSDGMAYLASGGIIIDENAINVHGETLKVYDGATLRGTIGESGGDFRLVSSNGDLWLEAMGSGNGVYVKAAAAKGIDLSGCSFIDMPVYTGTGYGSSGTASMYYSTHYGRLYIFDQTRNAGAGDWGYVGLSF